MVGPGQAKGELIVSWDKPIRPDVVATVIYEGADMAPKARAMVSYGTTEQALPRTTLRGLPSGQRVCLSAANLVAQGGRVSRAVSQPVCAVPR